MAEENVNDVSADAEAPDEIEESMVDESPAEPVEDVVEETAEPMAATAATEEVAAEPADEAEALGEVAEEAAADEAEALGEVAEEAVADEAEALGEVAEEAVADEPEALEEVAEEAAADEPRAVEDVATDVEGAASEAAEDATAAVAPAAGGDTPEVVAAEPKRKRKRVPRALRPARTRRTRPQSEERKPIVRLPKPDAVRGRRQERQGIVVSDAMDKTIVVKVDTIKAHRRYGKVMRRSAKFHAHDEGNEAKVGDVVRIVETRPLSATKHWRLAEIVQVAK